MQYNDSQKKLVSAVANLQQAHEQQQKTPNCSRVNARVLRCEQLLEQAEANEKLKLEALLKA
eukprot:2147972-Pleurochrysis_carterae.AAC.1